MLEAIQRELDELHVFFEEWFRASVADEDGVFARFADVLSPSFTLVTPGGESRSREEILDSVRRSYGVRRDDDSFAVEIQNVTSRPVAEGLHLVSYEEWQVWSGAKRGRLSTALLREAEGMPNGLLWEHVHETWMPELR